MSYSRVLLCLFGVHYAGATLLWPETYHFRAVLKIPSANITEPYEVWADGETENYRFDFYNGMTKIFRKQSVNNETTYYSINPESTGSYLNKEVCHELQADSRLVSSVLRKTYLPLSGRLSFVGKESLNNVKTNKWVYRAKSTEYDVTVDHRVWTLTKSVISGNSKVWIPIRHEYRLLQGDRELDFMQHDYANFTADKPDSTVFNLPTDLKCPLYESELRYEAVDPILELVNPDLEHARTSKAFETYKLKHNKEYKTKDEHFMRLQVFKNNLRYIQSINRQQNSYKLAVNHLADATEDELSVFLGTEISSELYDSDSEFVDDDINAKGYLDWRITGAVTSVKDQTTLCGSCYAFAVASAVESAAYIRNGFQHLEELSEQAIIDCTWGGSFANHGCDGGKPDYSLNWIREYGIFYKKDYGPYLAMAGYCDKDQPRLLTISGFEQAPRNVSIVKRMLRRKGPMIAAISLTRSLHFYSSGIYNDSNCSSNPDKRLHSVVIIGYGKENGQKFWIVKNSYGKQWGEKGYLRLDMKDNVCGIANYALASSEESESSSSSEEDDGASVDSRDIGPIRLDPNICPEGCEPDVFNKTYDLRNTRHKHEQDMIEQDRLVDLLRKDIEAHNKVKRKLAVQLDKRKNELREFMLEKQSCMNEVDQVIILRYDQIRASSFRGCTGPDGLSKTVVFPEALLKRLRKRVLELQDEIKQQKQRQKVNRTHLFRMNVDLRAMEAQAEELRAQMRDVLTRKLGKPRRVDKTLDDLLRQMARRHKFSTTLGTIPQVMKQIRGWRDRYSELEQKYLAVLNRHSERLRTAAALQADVLPQKPLKSVDDMAGTYDAEVYLRDVVRLRIVRSQQMNQMKALREEIKLLRLKPLSPRPPLPPAEPPWTQRDDIYLSMGPRSTWRPRKKYFPITPLGSQVKLVYDVNIMKLLYDCLDAMRVTRDDAEELLQELTALLPDVLSGAKSRYEVVDMLVKKWLLKYGGDPSQYKKQTRAFDALAALADRLIREHIETLEGTGSHEVMQQLEGALKAVAGTKEPLNARLGPALAALFHTAQTADLESVETMASLVKSLVDDDHPLTAESLERIDIFDVIEDIRECGVTASQEDIGEIVVAAIECLRAQLPTTEEIKQMEDEVEKALATERKSRSAAFSKASSRVVSIAPSAHSTDQSAKRSASTSRSIRSSFRADTAELGRTKSTTDTGGRTSSVRTDTGGRSTHSSDTGDKSDAETTDE